MTTALYRRYRPDTFQDVIGQEHVTAPLMAALRADRVTHAYLFSGPRGCGKTTSARILARCLNCEAGPTDTPCGTCPSCRDLATGGPGSLDVVEIDAASHNGVDDARDLRERAVFAPARDRYKVFILDEAHMVTAQGFNALLKLVEEPPAHVKFIFATTEPEKVIGTIRSRTHHYPFRLVPPDVLEAYLGRLCDAEGVEVGPGVFPLVVRAGGGSVRDTLSVMDQLIGGAVDGSVDYQRAVALLGYTDTTLLDHCVDALAAADGAGVFRVVDRVVESGHDPRRFVEDLLQRLRDLLVIALAGAEAGPALGSLPQDQLARMEVQARTIGPAPLSRAADLTAAALTGMVGATSPRLQLELLMARLLVPTAPSGTARADGAAGPPAPGPASGTVPPVRPTAQPTRAPQPARTGPTGPAAAREALARATGAQPGSPAPDETATAQPDAGRPQPEGTPVDAPEPGRPADQEQPRREATTGRDGAAPAAPGPRGATGQGPAGDEASAGESVRPGAAPEEPSPPGGGVPAGTGAAEGEMIRARWEEVLDAARRSRRATWALVGPNAQPGALRGERFEVLFTAPGLVGAFERGGHGDVMAAALHQALGLHAEVHAALAGGPGPADDRPGHGGGGPATPDAPGPGGPGEARVPEPGGTRAPGRTDRAEGVHAEGPGSEDAPTQDRPSPGAPALRAPQGGAPHPGGHQAAQAPASAASSPAAADDGWGPVAVPGGACATDGQASDEPAPSLSGTVPGGAQGTVGGPAVVGARSPATARPSRQEPSASLQPQTGGAAPVPTAVPAPSSGSPAPAPSPAQPLPEQAGPEATGPEHAASESDPDEPALATVHRLHPLPPLPHGVTAPGPTAGAHAPGAPGHVSTTDRTPREPARGDLPERPGPDRPTPSTGAEASTSPDEAGATTVRAGRAAPSGSSVVGVPWDGPDTFSDGVPLPEEPGDPDGAPEDGGTTWGPGPAAGSRMAAAIAAARAAAADVAAGPSGALLEEDLPSEDDPDAEEAGVVGLEVVKRLLGATVLEEVTVTEESR